MTEVMRDMLPREDVPLVIQRNPGQFPPTRCSAPELGFTHDEATELSILMMRRRMAEVMGRGWGELIERR
jgi:hypothetical protein